ncbi:MAG: ATPase, T2SS/T4P/T4SS family [Syntrophales bacterium]
MVDYMQKQDEQIAELQEILRLQRALQDITSSIHSARNTRQILTLAKDKILGLFDTEVVRIYAADRLKKEIYTAAASGGKAGDIRLAIDSRSIPGHVAYTKKAVNVADAYNKEELESIHRGLSHNVLADKKTGIRTRQVMAAPIIHNGELMGVLEIINKKDRPGRFMDEEPVLLQEIAEALGIALYNQQKSAENRKTRFDYLLDHGLIKEQELNASWVEAHRANQTVEEYLMKKFRISKNDIGKSLEEYYGCPFISFNERRPAPVDILRKLRREYLRRELWIPLEKVNGKTRVLVDDPDNILKRDTIENLLKIRSVEYCVALKEDILRYIDLFYREGESEESISDMLDRLEVYEEDEEDEELLSESDSVITQLVNKIIIDADARKASDIHIEPNTGKKTLDIRFRIDGDCVHYQTVPFSYRAPVVSRVKIMSNLDITERRLPQDGKIRFRKPGGHEIELRVATIPTQGNVEDVVMRILAKGEAMKLDEMNMSQHNYSAFLKVLEKPYGIILVVGPTGSGKTTTLHGTLNHINTPDMKIWTAEDPVEITQEGLRQVQVNPKIGFDFSNAMRAFLRADPDVIMVGEMRDFETAKIAVEASLTGHLVLSTLHTNSAPETIVRLLDMGIDPFNFADSLLAILAQRLVRTLCKCKVPYRPSAEELEGMIHYYGEHLFSELNITMNDDFRLFRPGGCDACNNTGYRGRMAIHELLVTSDRIKRMIAKREPVELIRETAVSEGMRTLLQDGVQKVVKGWTDFKQVLSVCIR